MDCFASPLDERCAIQYTKGMIETKDQVEQLVRLTDKERAFDYDRDDLLAVKIPPHYAALIDGDDPADPLRRQVVPTDDELLVEHQVGLDPQDERRYSVTSRLIHRYPSRVAFLTTDVCAIHCRHCFRRRFTSSDQGPANAQQIEEAALYVAAHPEVTEILFTGGDVLTLSDQRLKEMIEAFRSRRPDLIIRLCTRTVASYPQRITDELIAMLKTFSSAPFYLLTQFNHPREVTAQAIEAVARFVDGGIPALNQTVLLRGVNDSVTVLQELCNTLLFNRIKPYYLFQGDLVQSTAHFRVPLERGLAIERELRKRLSGLAMPTYALDLPEGGGKVPLSHTYLVGKEHEGLWNFETVDGQVRTYPDPPTD